MKKIISIFAAIPFFAAAAQGAEPFFDQLNAVRREILPKAAAVKFAAYTVTPEGQDLWLQQTHTLDATKRQAAVRQLRIYAHYDEVRDRVLAMLNDSTESVEVRREAVKTLSYLHNDPKAVAALAHVAFRSEIKELRLIGLKALFQAAAADFTVAAELLKTAQDPGDPEIQRAAVWGLFEAARNNASARNFLLKVVKDKPDYPEETRLEAVKSLFLSSDNDLVLEKILALAADRGEAESIRHAALTALSFRKEKSSVKDALGAVLRNEQNARLRDAARRALDGIAGDQLVAYFHLGYRNLRTNQYQSPLDAE